MISRGYAGLPPASSGQRIGLFGGSFDPPHEGHRAASLLALRRLRLDRIWWVVTSGNPLKDTGHLPSVSDRVDAARRLAAHPAIDVTGFEARLGSPYTYDLIAALEDRHPQVRFVFIMGADSFASLHHWKHWRRIIEIVPLAVVERPGFTSCSIHARAAAVMHRARLAENDAAFLASSDPPAYVFLHGLRCPLSSTALRARGRN